MEASGTGARPAPHALASPTLAPTISPTLRIVELSEIVLQMSE